MGFDDSPDFMEWRVNVKSRGRALLMLFLFSDIGPGDAPTWDQAGLARRHCPRIAAPGGGRRDAAAIVGERLRLDRDLPRGTGDGRGGTVYLCHPFLVHAAQPHRGTRPRFMAQPPLLPRAEFDPALPPRPSRTPSAEPAGWRSEAGRVRGVMSCDMGLYYPVRHSAVSGRHEYAQGSQS